MHFKHPETRLFFTHGAPSHIRPAIGDVQISRTLLIHLAASTARRPVRRLLRLPACCHHEVQHVATGACEDSQRAECLGLNLQLRLLEALFFWGGGHVWVQLHFCAQRGDSCLNRTHEDVEWGL